MSRAPFVSEDAQELAKEFRHFAHSVSHDLGAPARAIVEFTRLLQKEKNVTFSEDSELYLSLIIENGKKLQDMLDGLLRYSRLNTVAPALTDVNCNAVVTRSLLALKDKIDTTSAQIEVSELPVIEGDVERLSLLFTVLIENAITFRTPGLAPAIQISATKECNEWVFSVRDAGIGIEPEFYDSVFQFFQRLHSEEEYPGIGIGLALAKKIVDQHQGRIWIEETTGSGALFKFTLPALLREDRNV